jgi:purine-binding chemotaxis protein CheW
MTNLEDYFKTAVVTPEESPAPLRASESEQAFMEKYLGLDWKSRLAGSPLDRPAAVQPLAGFAAGAPEAEPDRPVTDEDEDEALEQGLAQAQELQLVGFYVGEEMFGVPMQFVSEVIRAPQPTKLPAAPPFLSGIVNLRGRVTPLIDMGVLLDIGQGRQEDAPRFVVVCRFRGLRLGLLVRAIAAMHRGRGADAEWNVEQQVGTGAAYLAGLLKTGEKLLRIVSVSSLFHKVMKA